jgi:hypothetical protein
MLEDNWEYSEAMYQLQEVCAAGRGEVLSSNVIAVCLPMKLVGICSIYYEVEGTSSSVSDVHHYVTLDRFCFQQLPVFMRTPTEVSFRKVSCTRYGVPCLGGSLGVKTLELGVYRTRFVLREV